MVYPGGAEAGYGPRGGSHPGFMAELVLRNIWNDTITVTNVVPFGERKTVHLSREPALVTWQGQTSSCPARAPSG